MKHRIVLYYHGGSRNHGCEAIIRATAKIFNEKLLTYAMYPNEDKEYQLDRVVELLYDKEDQIKKPSIKYYLSAIDQKVFHKTVTNTYFRWNTFFKNIKRGNVYLSTGGDNYCYTDLDKLSDYNYLIKKKGGKTVLWGCSIEPDNIKGNVIQDLKRYDLIVAREPITVAALYSAGIKDNVVQFPDPAFQLNKINLPLPEGFLEGNMVGLNLSPLIMSCEKEEGITLKNYLFLIDYILTETNMGIALIPHVVKGGSNDLKILKQIKDQYKHENRVILFQDYNCEEIKGFISRCRFFIGARTHSTIAAYSTCVPTIVVGYSVKARGIAKDIFGTYENYVLPVQNLHYEQDLCNQFLWLVKEEKQIKDYLKKKMPEYCASVLSAAKRVNLLLED